MSLLHTFCFWLALSPPLPPQHPACPHLPVVFPGGWKPRRARQVPPGGRGSPVVGISPNRPRRAFNKTEQGGPKAYVTEICICASLPNARIFFRGINYLLAYFSKVFFTDAIFHLFSLVLMHTLSYLSQRNIGTENFYLFQYWILLHDVIAVSATTQFPSPLYIPLLLSYYPGKFSLLPLCHLTQGD